MRATGSNDKLVKLVNIAERDRKITDVGSPVSLSGMELSQLS